MIPVTSLSSQLLSAATDWKAQFKLIEPAIQQLVQCYDYSAHAVRSRQSDVAPRLLNELWEELAGEFPSELDVRAAAVRLFSFDSRIPNWLESQIVRESNGEDEASEFNWTPSSHTAVVEVPAVMQALRDLHEKVANEMRGLCELTARLEDILSEETDEPVPSALDAMLESLACVKADDIRAAAVRLGIAESSRLAW